MAFYVKVTLFDQDLEAQNKTVTRKSNDTSTTASNFVNAGRGGAGNFIRKGSHDQEISPPPSLDSSSRESKGFEMRYSGRGGAGNFVGDAIKNFKVVAETKAKEAKAQAHDEMVRDVEKGLKVPEKAHLGSDKLV